MEKAVRVLATRDMDAASVLLAGDYNIDLAIKPVIKVEYFDNPKELLAAFERGHDAIVFSSKNAVRAFSKNVIHDKLNIPKVKTFAVGEETAKHLQWLGLQPQVPKKNNSKALAKLILKDNEIKSVLYCCGQRHREEFPRILEAKNITVERAVLYETVLLKPKVNLKGIRGVLFFSPSAVESFFAANEDNPGFPYFALGETTAKALRERTKNTVVIPPKPDTKSLFQKVQEYFLYKNIPAI